MITEKYRPKKESDFVGNDKAIQKFKEALERGSNVLLHGRPGIGKTTSVYMIAENSGYVIKELNASDERTKEELTDMLRRTKMRGFRKVLYLMDEADGLKDFTLLKQILDEARHPIVLTANEIWKIPQEIKSRCTSIRFYEPNIQDVLERTKKIVKAEGIDPKTVKYDKVHRDIRSSINAVVYDSEAYEGLDEFERVERILRGKGLDVEELGDKELGNLVIWLMDNIPNFYYGRDLINAYGLLSLITRTKRVELFRLFPEGRKKGKVEYPYYYKRRKAEKEAKKDGKKKKG